MECVFCLVNRKRSQEHFFPKWVRRFVPLGPDGAYNRASATMSRRDVGIKTVPVCKICNEGWMEGLQRSARPMLEPLILGRRALLTPAFAADLARWAVMTGMALEGDHETSRGVPQYERSQFARDQKISENWEIYIGISPYPASRGFSHTAWMDNDKLLARNFATIAQASVIMLGRLIVLVASQYLELKDAKFSPADIKMYEIYPKVDYSFNLTMKTMSVAVDHRDLHKTWYTGEVSYLDYPGIITASTSLQDLQQNRRMFAPLPGLNDY